MFYILRLLLQAFKFDNHRHVYVHSSFSSTYIRDHRHLVSYDMMGSKESGGLFARCFWSGRCCASAAQKTAYTACARYNTGMYRVKLSCGMYCSM